MRWLINIFVIVVLPTFIPANWGDLAGTPMSRSEPFGEINRSSIHGVEDLLWIIPVFDDHLLGKSGQPVKTIKGDGDRLKDLKIGPVAPKNNERHALDDHSLKSTE